MAEAKPADSSRESVPKLVAMPEPEARHNPTPARRPQPRREPDPRGISWLGVALALLALAVVGFVVQTQRVHDQAAQIEALNGQVEGLQVQLSAAHTQLATYDMQLTLVRTSVANMFEQLTNLNDLVNGNPFSPPSAPPATPTPR